MVKSNPALRRRLLYSPTGPVGREAKRRGRNVQNRAKILVGAKRAVDTGNLRRSIEVTNPRPHPRGQVVSVGSNLEYSIPVHDGSGSKFAPPSWKAAAAAGRPVPARRYLTEALPAANK